MKFSDLDEKMRIYEKNQDVYVLPGIYIVVRLDGRSFHAVTKDLEKPFDNSFHSIMSTVTTHLIKEESFDIVYGYHQSDEISFLLRKETSLFNRKERKINSVFAGVASSVFTKNYGIICSFDSRVCHLPSTDVVIDYFRWRQEDCFRNCLNTYSYWTLRKAGLSASDATLKLQGLANDKKHDLLFENNININNAPDWQKRGTGYYFKSIEKEGFNPKTNEKSIAQRNVLIQDASLPYGDAYSNLLKGMLEPA